MFRYRGNDGNMILGVGWVQQSVKPACPWSYFACQTTCIWLYFLLGGSKLMDDRTFNGMGGGQIEKDLVVPLKKIMVILLKFRKVLFTF